MPEIPIAALRRLGKAGSLRRNKLRGETGKRGRVIGHRPLDSGATPGMALNVSAGDIHIPATLSRILERHLSRGDLLPAPPPAGDSPTPKLHITPEDLRIKIRRETPSTFILFLLDTSDSMGAIERMAVTKAAVLALLQRAYQSRHTVALITFGGTEPRILLKPTRSVLLAKKALEQLRPDGGTPLAAGLSMAADFLKAGESRFAKEERRLIIISDGEGNLSLNGGAGKSGSRTAGSVKRRARQNRSPLSQAMGQAARLGKLKVEKVFIDTKLPVVGKVNEMRQLARESGGRYFNLSNPGVGAVLSAVEAG